MNNEIEIILNLKTKRIKIKIPRNTIYGPWNGRHCVPI